MKKLKVILTVGISGSGKTTWAEEQVRRDPRLVNINRDDLRVMNFCGGDYSKYDKYKFTKVNEKLITSQQIAKAEWALEQGRSIIVSDTNLVEDRWMRWRQIAKEYGAEFETEVFDTPLSVCIERNRKRVVTLPKGLMIRQYRELGKVLDRPMYEPDDRLPKAIVVDQDGTLYRMGDRSPFDMTRVYEDEPVFHIVELVNMYAEAGYKIVHCSGRNECAREQTLAAHDRDGIPGDDLFMRADNDNRPDFEIKQEILLEDIAPKYNIRLVLDDRTQVVDMWREMGIPCLQVDHGDF